MQQNRIVKWEATGEFSMIAITSRRANWPVGAHQCTLAVVLFVLVGCATSDPYPELAQRRANAVADAEALGERGEGYRTEHAAIARAAIAEAPNAELPVPRRIDLYALGVDAARVSQDAGVIDQSQDWAQSGAQLCAALPVESQAASAGSCDLLDIYHVIFGGEHAVDEMTAAAAEAGRAPSDLEFAELEELTRTFTDRFVTEWTDLTTSDPGVTLLELNEWTQQAQLDQWCAYRSVSGLEALRSVAANSREAFQLRDAMRERYLAARALAAPLLTYAPPGSIVQPISTRPRDEDYADAVCAELGAQ